VTFNDVVLACQAKATRLYFDHHNPNKNFSPVMSYMATSERVDATIGNCILAAFVTLELPLDAETSCFWDVLGSVTSAYCSSSKQRQD